MSELSNTLLHTGFATDLVTAAALCMPVAAACMPRKEGAPFLQHRPLQLKLHHQHGSCTLQGAQLLYQMMLLHGQAKAP